jgi:AcrR family transcriptional regulator
MATKTQKQTENLNDKIIHSYMDHVLTEKKQPASVYAFAKHLNIPEAEFYRHFASFRDIDTAIWKNVAEDTINTLMASPEFGTYNAREKMLGFFYTLIEALNNKRSYYLYSLKEHRPLNKNLSQFREQVLNFAKPAIQQGLADNELLERKFISDRYHEAVWVNTMFILNFWANDSSKGFEKTDAAIEKSVNLMLELMGKSALDSVLDMGKFLLQNVMKK